MIRSFLPIDLFVIVTQNGLLSDVASTKENVGSSEAAILPSMARLLIRSMNLRDRRHTWVKMNGLDFRGLAAVRSRAHLCTWEVEHLVLKNCDTDCAASLLERLSLTGGELGIERIFLRLPADDSLLDAACNAGFSPYLREDLYYCSNEDSGAGFVDDGPTLLRRRRWEDEYGLFDLYRKTVPASIQRVEGLTYKDWKVNRERGLGSEWVFEKGGQISAWFNMRRKRQHGQLDILTLPEEEMEQIVDNGLRLLEGCRTRACLLPSHQARVSSLLQSYGFSVLGSYEVLSKEPVYRKKLPCLIPASA